MGNRKIVKSKDEETGVEVTTFEIDIDYQDSFVAFLDVLGFQEIVLGNREQDRKKLMAYFDVVEYFKAAVRNIDEKSRIKILAVSDSIILTLPIIEGHDEVDQFRQFCIAAGLLQEHLVLNDIWIRGAVTVGKVAHRPENSFILGPAYIKAFELEKAAVFPRIIVDGILVTHFKLNSAQDLIDAVNKDIKFRNWQGNILFDWGKAKRFNVPLQQDAPIFIDFLQKFFTDEFAAGNARRALSGIIQDNILLGVKIYPKFRWVVDYFLSKFRMDVSRKDDEPVIETLKRL